MSATPSLDVVIPVYNEERDLAPNITKLRDFLVQSCPYRWRVVIANNASTDRTLEIAQALAVQYPGEVTYIHLEEKGRGRALKRAWLASTADVVCYMDVDLSTDLRHLMPLVEPIFAGRYHIAIGSRLMPGARVTRQLKREVISRAYNLIIKLMFPRRRFSDAQCRRAALRRSPARPSKTSCLTFKTITGSSILNCCCGLSNAAIQSGKCPVEWIEDLDSRVKIIPTAIEDLKGLWRVRTTKFKA
jgi:glycosyltransferase involved in cell wall biosynthesis